MTLSALQIVAVTLCTVLTLTGVALLARSAGYIYRVISLGQPDHGRRDRPAARTATLLREFLGHTRMSRLPVVAVAHWFTMVSFGLLFLSLVTAYGQLVHPQASLWLLGHFPPYEWLVEGITLLGLAGIITLIAIRQRQHPRRRGRASRFYGSSVWQAYYVEFTILGVLICIVALRSLEYALDQRHRGALHYPLGQLLGSALTGLPAHALANAIVVVAAVKITISMAWAITLGLQPTMGVAWHRFLAFANIWFKRHPGSPAAGGGTSLGALQPISIGGAVLDFENVEDLDEGAALGVGAVEQFTWKGLLDFSTCTECGRCQDQCPAWNTQKPLSPKLLVLGLRDHAYAKAPWLLAGEAAGQAAAPAGETASAAQEQAQRPLIGATGYQHDDPLGAYSQPGGVIDPDVLWSCVTCGACVEQCPVDIEHVDHIVDLRRNQVLIESAFPNELTGLFKNLEKNANPWGMSPRLRLDWAKGLPFEVKQVGADVESLAEVEYLFWVGCAGAYEDRQKKTTRAIAELLHLAGVEFAVLGEGEACTGDSARRSGNEFLFQQLAMQNVETLNEAGATKIVVSCAHCFNTLANEYPQLGGHYEVVHHTQLLNRLVREGRLTPIAPVGGGGAALTYHDPCYLGRHNGVYSPPRELIGALPGLELTEMPRNRERSFCCGAGGARMWMEEKLGSRINLTRTDEALATGAATIAVGCPFCRVMLSDGLTSRQSDGAGAGVQVLDVAQLLLEAVNRPAP